MTRSLNAIRLPCTVAGPATARAGAVGSAAAAPAETRVAVATANAVAAILDMAQTILRSHGRVYFVPSTFTISLPFNRKSRVAVPSTLQEPSLTPASSQTVYGVL